MRTLLHGDCLELMKDIPDRSVDMVFCDLPYQTTACRWDVQLPLDELWAHYNRIVKPRCAIVLTACQPFTSLLVASNVKRYKTSWVWRKDKAANFANANRHPLKVTEDVLVFGVDSKSTRYYPQMRTGRAYRTWRKPEQRSDSHLIMLQKGRIRADEYRDQYYPKNVIEIPRVQKGAIHPTEKPVALIEYFLRTYSIPGDLILDNCAGSGSTGIACLNLNRSFIGIEKDDYYFHAAKERIEQAEQQLRLLIAV
jgi:predicted methyltransferase